VGLIIANDLQVFDAKMEISTLRLFEAMIPHKVRVIGLSQTALANCNDIACFLGICPESTNSVYNFVFPGNNDVEVVSFSRRCEDVCMEQTILNIIMKHLPYNKVAVILVTMKKDVLTTAAGLKTRVMRTNNPMMWRQKSESVFETQDANVGLMLEYGIGIIHSGLSKYDCDIVKTCVRLREARILVISIDLADSIRLKPHLLVVKGTEMFDAKEDGLDVPVPKLTNEMYSCSSSWQKAFILTQDSTNILYKSYFEGGLSVESQLLPVLPESLNNEIVAGAINTRDSAVDSGCKEESRKLVTTLVDKSLVSLKSAGCIRENSGFLHATVLGSLVSFYNLSHSTIKYLSTNLSSHTNLQDLVVLMCKCDEFRSLCKKDEDKQLMK
ncbi:hypothetical protein L9F63_001239, partial [Diploptera punctata]